jgi:hypothetical protein
MHPTKDYFQDRLVICAEIAIVQNMACSAFSLPSPIWFTSLFRSIQYQIDFIRCQTAFAIELLSNLTATAIRSGNISCNGRLSFETDLSLWECYLPKLLQPMWRNLLFICVSQPSHLNNFFPNERRRNALHDMHLKGEIIPLQFGILRKTAPFASPVKIAIVLIGHPHELYLRNLRKSRCGTQLSHPTFFLYHNSLSQWRQTFLFRLRQHFH